MNTPSVILEISFILTCLNTFAIFEWSNFELYCITKSCIIPSLVFSKAKQVLLIISCWGFDLRYFWITSISWFIRSSKYSLKLPSNHNVSSFQNVSNCPENLCFENDFIRFIMCFANFLRVDLFPNSSIF